MMGEGEWVLSSLAAVGKTPGDSRDPKSGAVESVAFSPESKDIQIPFPPPPHTLIVD